MFVCMYVCVYACVYACMYVAGRAALLGSGLAQAWGCLGLALWMAGWHGSTDGECVFWSLAVALGSGHGHGLAVVPWLVYSGFLPAYPPQVAPVRPGVVKWAVDVCQTNRGCSCLAPSCKTQIQRGDLRCKSADDSSTSRFYHVSCIVGGLGPQGRLEVAGPLSAAEQNELTLC